MATDRPCPVVLRDGVCGRPLPPGAEACGACTTNLRLDLEAVPVALAELDVAITRQTHMTAAGGGSGCPEGCGHWPESPYCVAGARLTFDARASEAALALRLVLHGWIRVWDEETPIADVVEGPLCGPRRHFARTTYVPGCTHDSCRRVLFTTTAETGRALQIGTPEAQAHTLAARVPQLAGRPWLPDLATELAAALREAWAACDRPPDQRVVGRCMTDGCGAPVYAAEGSTSTTCRPCGTRWEVQALRDASLAAAEHFALPAVALAVVLGVPAGTIRSWRSRELLSPVGVNAAGQPLYRVSDGHALKIREDTA